MLTEKRYVQSGVSKQDSVRESVDDFRHCPPPPAAECCALSRRQDVPGAHIFAFSLGKGVDEAQLEGDVAQHLVRVLRVSLTSKAMIQTVTLVFRRCSHSEFKTVLHYSDIWGGDDTPNAGGQVAWRSAVFLGHCSAQSSLTRQRLNLICLMRRRGGDDEPIEVIDGWGGCVSNNHVMDDGGPWWEVGEFGGILRAMLAVVKNTRQWKGNCVVSRGHIFTKR